MSEGIDHLEVIPQESQSKSVSSQEAGNWVIGGASCIGLGHVQKNIPCQDNHHIEHWGNDWGIAISCDGAGSAKKSDVGSSKVAKEFIPKNIKNKLDSFIVDQKIPTLEEWKKIAIQALFESLRDLKTYADEQQDDLKELACTAIIVVYSPFGLLQCNIGDGRACYRDQSGQWHTLMKPYKPDNGEANVTVFLTSQIWDTPNKAEQHIYFNTVSDATAFALMSDGCENYMFICSPVNPETGEDPNKPQAKFFEPLYQYVQTNRLTAPQISLAIQDYLQTDLKLIKEQDDKTLLLAVNCSNG